MAINEKCVSLDSNEAEQLRLRNFVVGKTITDLSFEGMGEDIVIRFNDNTEVAISHLGGLEIERIGGR